MDGHPKNATVIHLGTFRLTEGQVQVLVHLIRAGISVTHLIELLKAFSEYRAHARECYQIIKVVKAAIKFA